MSVEPTKRAGAEPVKGRSAEPTLGRNAEPTGRRELTAWLIGQTRGLLAPLGLAVVARVLGQLLGVALFVTAAALFVRAAEPGFAAPVHLSTAVAWLAGIAVAKALLRYGEHYAGHYVAFTSLQRLRDAFFSRLIPQAPAATQGRAGAELTSRATSDIDRIEVFFAHSLPPAVSAVTVPIVALIWLAITTDGWLALTLAVTVFALLALPLLTRRGAVEAATASAAVRGQIAERLGDDVQGIREVLSFDSGTRRRAGLAELDALRSQAASRVGASQATRAGLAALLQGGGLIAVLFVATATGASPAAIVIALAVGVGLIGPARGFEDYVTGLDNAFAATARIREVMEAEPAVTDPTSTDPISTAPSRTATGSTAAAHAAASSADQDGGARIDHSPSVEFDSVSFGYAPGAEGRVLTDVSLSVSRGTWVHVVGVSGSGKSTLASLLLRGWDPDAGCVRLGGDDIRGIPLDDLRRLVSLAPQRPTTLRGTLRHNLTLAAPDASDDAIAHVLIIAGLPDWMQRLDEQLGPRGLSISGGQLQRLSLARALLPNPQILIIDEGLSQLDAATAAEVRQRLESIGDLTIIEITHRTDLIADDAEVWVLDLGRVVESGPAGTLRSGGGPFSRLEARTGDDV